MRDLELLHANSLPSNQGLDYHITAERYLFKQLSKTKRIAELPTFQEFQESKNVSTDGPKSTAEANILARLFKSNPVKNAMPNLLADIRRLLGVNEAPTGKSGMKEAAQKEKSKKPKSESESESEAESTVPLKKAEKKKSTKDAEQDSQPEDGVSGSEGEGFNSDELEQFGSRLAPGSGSEDESESEDADESGGLGPDDISDSVSRGSSPEFSAEDSPPPKKAKASKGSAAPAKETTFLPSLMMGGYWSGSEEASDDEAAAPKRKNRMGQQARRALWEKKYGAGANHVQKEQQQQKRNRDSGWDTKRGATAGGRGGFGGRQQNRYEGGSGFTGGQSNKPKAPPKDEGPLHPSWEAKRKQKEQTTAAFAGKKVVFD